MNTEAIAKVRAILADEDGDPRDGFAIDNLLALADALVVEREKLRVALETLVVAVEQDEVRNPADVAVAAARKVIRETT